MIIHSFTTKVDRDAAAVTIATQYAKTLSIDLAEGEDLRIRDFNADLEGKSRDPITFTNRFLIVAGKRKLV